jgi:hypothetical protein
LKLERIAFEISQEEQLIRQQQMLMAASSGVNLKLEEPQYEPADLQNNDNIVLQS